MIAKQTERRKFWSVRMPFEPMAVTALVFAMFFALTASAGAASLAGTGLLANVPFDFYCGQKHFQPGRYFFEYGMSPEPIVTIRPANGATSGWFLGVPQGSPSGSAAKPSLLFTRYPDGRSYLREIRHPLLVGSYFPKSRREVESGAALMVGVEPISVMLLARVR